MTKGVEAKHRMHGMNMDEGSTDEGSTLMPPSASIAKFKRRFLSLSSQHLRGADKVLPHPLSKHLPSGHRSWRKECGFTGNF